MPDRAHTRAHDETGRAPGPSDGGSRATPAGEATEAGETTSEGAAGVGEAPSLAR